MIFWNHCADRHVGLINSTPQKIYWTIPKNVDKEWNLDNTLKIALLNGVDQVMVKYISIVRAVHKFVADTLQISLEFCSALVVDVRHDPGLYLTILAPNLMGTYPQSPFSSE